MEASYGTAKTATLTMLRHALVERRRVAAEAVERRAQRRPLEVRLRRAQRRRQQVAVQRARGAVACVRVQQQQREGADDAAERQVQVDAQRVGLVFRSEPAVVPRPCGEPRVAPVVQDLRRQQQRAQRAGAPRAAGAAAGARVVAQQHPRLAPRAEMRKMRALPLGRLLDPLQRRAQQRQRLRRRAAR